MSKCSRFPVSKSKALVNFYEAEPDYSPDAQYKKSYYQYKGILYKTKYIHSTMSLSFEPEEIDVLLDNLEYALSDRDLSIIGINQLKNRLRSIEKILNKLPENKRSKHFQYELNKVFNVAIISSVHLEFASDITMFWCPRCHRLYYPKEIKMDAKYCYPVCPSCEGRVILEQAPVWVARSSTRRRALVLPLIVGTYIKRNKNNKDEINKVDYWKKGWYLPCPKCGAGEMKYYIHKDPARFLERSALVCDRCGYEQSLFNRDYVLTLPTQHLTQPIVGRTYNYLQIERVEELIKAGEKEYKQYDLKRLLNLPGGSSPLINTEYIESFLYIPEIDIKKVVVGLKYGLKGKKTYPTRKTGIMISTCAIYIRINERYYSKVVDHLKLLEEYLCINANIDMNEKVIKHLVLHSLAHALMGRLPLYSGISLDNFEYIYSPSRNEIIIYEAGDGSLGALENLTKVDESSQEPIIYDYLANVKETIIRCSCEGVCKYCLALPGCQEYNKNLNRFSLSILFGVEDPEDLVG